ncbi:MULTISPECIES: GNAT family N-acetyltransferase [Providencia]|uniref:Acetyltransferase (GNAT) family n=2 Tax=Morganellaceae TaxID=1903414 RepID=A0A9N8GX11_PRORE|nr:MULTISPECIES: GNAT family N-acetyltransferase [Providencia]EFE55035.1 acetyltransferase, GNAT family [Providencia rettgeri DSM 1131]EHZ6872563.1 GNAT family N-acetyltransferase [Providencia rettgeri]MBI6188525.1 GNAT family N-acetyltransferase [Providencia rettgeri]MBN7842449.1 GNAT family N-acetyltransferase [Providencia rettgeri]MBN7855997.1 GNAT family N-acetyltransferase [Providencia rettgeri]
MKITGLETARLRLRGWQEEDKQPLYQMNSHPDVMRYFPSVLNEQQNAQFMETIIDKFAQQGGWGLWAVELKSNKQFIGFIGLNIPAANLPFSPCVEIGWRLLPEYWRHGYATEGAHAAIKFAFEQLKLEELVAFTAVVNLPSESVMQRLGMIKHPNNFYHPALPDGHWLQEHVLYRIKASDYLKSSHQ